MQNEDRSFGIMFHGPQMKAFMTEDKRAGLLNSEGGAGYAFMKVGLNSAAAV